MKTINELKAYIDTYQGKKNAEFWGLTDIYIAIVRGPLCWIDRFNAHPLEYWTNKGFETQDEVKRYFRKVCKE